MPVVNPLLGLKRLNSRIASSSEKCELYDFVGHSASSTRTSNECCKELISPFGVEFWGKFVEIH